MGIYSHASEYVKQIKINNHNKKENKNENYE